MRKGETEDLFATQELASAYHMAKCQAKTWNYTFSDHTFYAQSLFKVEKLPNFFWQNLSAFVREWQLMWHQRPLVAISWRPQIDSAENWGFLPP